jgi:hypothetical protein
MRQLKGRKVEDSGELSVFIDGIVMSGVPNLLSPNLQTFKPSYGGCIIYPKARFVKPFMPIKT